MLRRPGFHALAAFALALSSAQTARAVDAPSLATGFDYSSGKYGAATPTQIWYLPLAAKYETECVTYKLTIPYIRIAGPGSVVSAGDSPVVLQPENATTRTSASGLGDVVGSVAYNLSGKAARWPLIDVTGKVKFGTASRSKGLGTGENDYALQLDALKTFGAFSPFVTAGYKRLGRAAGFDLKNVWYGSLGGAFRLTPQTSAGAVFDARQSSTIGGRAPREMTAYASHKLDGRTKLLGYVVKGFSDGSPDYGVGLMLNIGF